MSLLDRVKNKLLFQKIKYLSRKDYIKKTEYGFNIILDLKKDVDLYFYRGIFEKENLEYFGSLIKPGNIILDIGANIGIYSLMASVKTGNIGKVYSFEPADWAINRLKENIRLNKFENIEVIDKAISDISGISDFFICDDDAYNSIGNKPMREVREVKKVEITTIDDFLSSRSISHVDIIKIDTEGADYLVLKGAKQLLSSSSPPIIFCEYSRKTIDGFHHSLNEFEEYIKGFNYKIFEIQGNNLIEFNSSISQSNEIVCIKNA